MGTKPQKWLCAQIGAREHFAVARALHRDQRLATLYTDFWASGAEQKLARRIDVEPLRSIAARFHPELVGADIRAWNCRCLRWEAEQRYRRRRDPRAIYSGS